MRKCILCGNENFESLDYLRGKPENMVLCKTCGMVQIERFKNEKEIFDFYSSGEYRKPPKAVQYHTGNIKVQFHSYFLKEYIEENKDKELNICDIGAAQGMFLAWIKTRLPKAKISGTEWTESYKRNAFWEYKIELKDDIDLSQKYDFISCYKVLEHMFDINESIEKYKNALTENGVLYISVPTWFNALHLFGSNNMQVSFDNYFHENHINVWSKNNFRNLLHKHGLEIIKEDHLIYDSTYLCKVTSNAQNMAFDNSEEIKASCEKIKKACDSMNIGKFEEAITHWQNFPGAWQMHYENNRKEIYAKGGITEIHKFIDDMLSKCDTVDMYVFAGRLCWQYNDIDGAQKYYEMANNMRPNEPEAIKKIAELYQKVHATTGDVMALVKAREAYAFMRMTFRDYFDYCTNWIYAINAALPVPTKENNEIKEEGN